MDIVYIRDLEIETVIGIYDWEREIKQKITINLQMKSDFTKAAENDEIEYALDYKEVAKRLISFVEESSFQLVETLSVRIAEIVQEEFGVTWLRLELGKPGAVTGSRDVGVIIERGSKADGGSY
ncbi:MAG: dihydroneopterin aldolase [Pseudohongiellaceae bacterium]|jgi:dihydroneopterin aldolase